MIGRFRRARCLVNKSESEWLGALLGKSVVGEREQVIGERARRVQCTSCIGHMRLYRDANTREHSLYYVTRTFVLMYIIIQW